MLFKNRINITIITLFGIVELRPIDDGTARILRLYNVSDGLGNYTYAYQTSNGIYREETGSFENSANSVKGAYSYSNGDQRYEVRYVADEQGYRPTIIQYSIQPASAGARSSPSNVYEDPLDTTRGGDEFSLNALGLPVYPIHYQDVPIEEDAYTAGRAYQSNSENGPLPESTETASGSTTEAALSTVAEELTSTHEYRKYQTIDGDTTEGRMIQTMGTNNTPQETDGLVMVTTDSAPAKSEATESTETTNLINVHATPTTAWSQNPGTDTTITISDVVTDPEVNTELPNEHGETSTSTTEKDTQHFMTATTLNSVTTIIAQETPTSESTYSPTTDLISESTTQCATSETLAEVATTDITTNETTTAVAKSEENMEEPITPIVSIDTSAIRSLAGGGFGK